jgi:hypothetical protein
MPNGPNAMLQLPTWMSGGKTPQGPNVEWWSLSGKPYVTVSPVGLAAGFEFNNGADFGPDTPGTQTSGIQEAVNSVNQGVENPATPLPICLLSGLFKTYTDIILPYTSNLTLAGSEGTYIQAQASGTFTNGVFSQTSSVSFPAIFGWNISNIWIDANGIAPHGVYWKIAADLGFNNTWANVNCLNATDYNWYLYGIANGVMYNCQETSGATQFSTGHISGKSWYIYHSEDTSVYISCSGSTGTTTGIVQEMQLYGGVWRKFNVQGLIQAYGTVFYDLGTAESYCIELQSGDLYSCSFLANNQTTGPIAIQVNGSSYFGTEGSAARVNVWGGYASFAATTSSNGYLINVSESAVVLVDGLTLYGTTDYTGSVYDIANGTNVYIRSLMVDPSVTVIHSNLQIPPNITNPPVSGTTYQNTTGRALDLVLPTTFTPTAGAAATMTPAIGPTSTVSAQAAQSVPAGTALDSFVLTYPLKVPAGWYYKFTTVNATLGTMTVQFA